MPIKKKPHKNTQQKMKETNEQGQPKISAKTATKYLMQLEAKADELGVI